MSLWDEVGDGLIEGYLGAYGGRSYTPHWHLLGYASAVSYTHLTLPTILRV